MILLSIGMLAFGVVYVAFSEDLPVKVPGFLLTGLGAGMLIGHAVFATCSTLP